MKNLTSSLISFLLFIPSIYPQVSVNEHSIKFKATDNAVLVGEDGVIRETTDFGESWIDHVSGVTNTLYGIDLSESFNLAVGENGLILRNTSGTSWQQMNSGTTVNLNDVEIVDNDHAVACGDNGTILISSDGGIHWEIYNTGISQDLKDVDFFGSTGYIVGRGGKLFKSVDNGRSWTAMDMSFTGANFNCVEIISPEKLFIVGEDGFIIYTQNNGQSWQAPVSALYESNYNDIVFFDENTGIAVGDNGLLLRTTNGGWSWYGISMAGAVLDKDINSVAFSGMTDGILIGDEGIKYKSEDGGITWYSIGNLYSNKLVSQNSNLSELRQNYPNPFNPSTTISYIIKQDSFVSLKIYDMTGREVRTVVNSYQKAGTYNINLTIDNLSSGTYIYVLKTDSENNSESNIMKMMLIK